MAMQPGRAGWLLADAGGGTPQRFNWFPGNDKRMTLEAANGDPIAGIPLPSWQEWEYITQLKIPDEAALTIRQARIASVRGEMDALDGHALFCREKFAYGLAVLDGRSAMNLEDWQLSGIASEVSNRTRAWVKAQLFDAEAGEAEQRGRLMGVAAAASDVEKAVRTDDRKQRICKWILKKITDAGTPVSTRDLSRAAGKDSRPFLSMYLEALQGAGRITKDDDGKWVLSS